jgi:galactonate dehydratase
LSTEAARITDLEIHVGGTSWRNLTFVKLSTDAGITGWGEATLEYREHAVVSHLEFLAHLVQGLDALAPAAVWKRVVEDDWFRGDIVGLAAASSVMVACLDIAGKAHGVPAHRLLGGPVRDRIPVYANGWYRGERTPESFAAMARTVVERGYRALKVDPYGAAGMLANRRHLAEADELLAAVRETVGSEVEIYVDAHGRFTPAVARAAAEALARHDVGYLEEPVAPENLSAMRELRTTSPIPIAGGERCIGRVGFRALIEGDAVDVIQPDICWCGGLLEAQRIAAWADLHQMVVSLHNANSPFATLTGCHLGASIPNFLVLETFDDFDEPWLRDAFPDAPAVEGGTLPLPQRPGIGVEPDEAVLAEHPHRPVFMNLNEPGWELRQPVIE